MTEQEQIEKWRKKFEEQFDSGNEKYESGYYKSPHRESMWQGFHIAMESMPVIEIPAYDMIHFAPVRNLIAQFESLGIQYTIKGE
jgi:hypothetical protein